MNSKTEMTEAKCFQRIGLSTRYLYVACVEMQYELQNKIIKDKKIIHYKYVHNI